MIIATITHCTSTTTTSTSITGTSTALVVLHILSVVMVTEGNMVVTVAVAIITGTILSLVVIVNCDSAVAVDSDWDLINLMNFVVASSPCCADPVLIPTHAISRTTNSLDTITNRPAILTVTRAAVQYCSTHTT